jgi:hypothetical protein
MLSHGQPVVKRSPNVLSGQPWFSVGPTLWTRTARSIFLLLLCAYFAYCFAIAVSFLDLPAYARGQAMTPYQFRVLPMLAFRGLLASSRFLRLAGHIAPLKSDPYRLVDFLLAFGGILGAVFATRLTIARLTRDTVYAFWASLPVLFMAYFEVASSWGPMYTLPYDVPALFFFAAAIYLIVSGRHLAFYALFPIAVFNRETACFMTIFFAIWEWVRMGEAGLSAGVRLRRIAPPVLAQMVLWIAIKWYLLHLFGHNPSDDAGGSHGLFTTKTWFNLRELMKPQQWPLLLSICGFSLPFLYRQRRWIQCDGLFYACAIILPLYFTGMMIVGVIIEIRIFTECIALVVPALALLVHHRFQPVPEPGEP